MSFMSTAPFVIFASGQYVAFSNVIAVPGSRTSPLGRTSVRDGDLPVFAQVTFTPERSATFSVTFVRTRYSEPSPEPSAVELITSATRTASFGGTTTRGAVPSRRTWSRAPHVPSDARTRVVSVTPSGGISRPPVAEPTTTYATPMSQVASELIALHW